MSEVRTKRLAYQAQWYQDNKDHCNAYYQDYRDKAKREVVEAYGGKCTECGESDYIVLNIDHIYNDGYLDREKGLEGGFKLYKRLKREGWPKDRYQLLCCNCNYRKEHFRRRNAVSFTQAG